MRSFDGLRATRRLRSSRLPYALNFWIADNSELGSWINTVRKGFPFGCQRSSPAIVNMSLPNQFTSWAMVVHVSGVLYLESVP